VIVYIIIRKEYIFMGKREREAAHPSGGGGGGGAKGGIDKKKSGWAKNNKKSKKAKGKTFQVNPSAPPHSARAVAVSRWQPQG